MTQRLTDMDLTRVSVVDKGANARRFAVLKRDEEGAMTGPAARADETPAGIAAWLRKAADLVLGRPEPVSKVQTFAAMVAGQELQDALGDSWWTLNDALWSAIYATDESGADLTLEAKQALVAQDLDEFKAYLLAEMGGAAQIGKRATDTDQARRQVAAAVAKAGRKISGARLERLQAASEALDSVLAEVAEVTSETGSAQEETVEKAELAAVVTEAVAKAQEPLVARIEAIEKAAGTAQDPAAEADELTLEGVAKAILEIRETVEGIAKAKGERQSQAGQDGGERVKKSVFAGIL